MPDYLPPPGYSGTPHRFLLPAGTELWRVHPKRHAPTDFTKYRDTRRFRSERFAGCAADPYATWHASETAATILADVLLRSTVLTDDGYRMVHRVAVNGQRASLLATAVELSLLSLCDEAGLAAVGQDTWLIVTDDSHPLIRPWASWLRTQASWAAGFIWPPRLSARHFLVVLFDDRCPATDTFDPESITQIDLDDENGAAWLNLRLRPYRVRIEPPRPGLVPNTEQVGRYSDATR